MARVVAFVPDLLFGSRVHGDLGAAGHSVALVGAAHDLREALSGADVLVVDLTVDAAPRIELARAACPPHVRVLAFYSHVDTMVRDQARAAGFDLVVPRSRMAREGAALLARLLGGAAEPGVE